MASGDINFRMGGDASGALAAQDKVRQSQGRVNDAMRLGANVSKSTSQRIIRDNESQIERFKRLRSEIFRGWQQGKLSTELYGRAVRNLEKDYKSQGGAFKKFATDAKQELGEIKEDAGEVGGEFENWAPRIISGLSAIQLFRQGVQEVQSAIENSQESLTGRRKTAGSLRQLVDTQAQFDQLKETAVQFRVAGAVDSLAEGEDVTFNLKSVDFLDAESKKLFLQLGSRQVVPDLGKFARAIRTQVSSFGREETGDAVQIASKAFAASAFAPGSVEGLLEATSQVAGIASALGISDEETTTSTAFLSKSTGKQSVAGSTLRAFLGATAQLEGFEGLSIPERVRKLRDQRLSAEELLKSPSQGGLGSVEAFRAFSDLSKVLPALEQAIQVVERANLDRSSIDRKIRIKDPLAEAVRLSEAADGRAEIAGQSLAARKLITDGILKRENAILASQDDTALGTGAIGLKQFGTGTVSFFGGQRAADLVAGRAGRGATSEEIAALEELRSLPDQVKQQTTVVEKMLGELIAEQKRGNDAAERRAGQGGLPVSTE